MYSIPPKISQVKLKKKEYPRSCVLRQSYADYIFSTIPKDLQRYFQIVHKYEIHLTYTYIRNLQMTWGESSSSTLEGHLICFLQQIFHEKLKCSRDYYWNGGSNFANIFICLHNFLDSSLEKRQYVVKQYNININDDINSFFMFKTLFQVVFIVVLCFNLNIHG